MAINFNVDPYFDNYDEDKKFLRILFRPGYAVQARELTQLQTILQKQIERQGNHFFKEGAMVIPGHVSYDTKVKHVKLTAKYNGVDTNGYVLNLIGKTFVGQTSGAQAEIITASKATTADANMVFVKYIQSGKDDDELVPEGELKTFKAGEIITATDGSYSVQIQPTASNPFGDASIASVGRGVFYIKGFFVLVEDQTIILNKYSKLPSYKVGLRIVESLVAPEDDETLLDNAQNSYNYAAPGAHRYAIDTILEKRSLTSAESAEFIELLRLKAGKIQYIVNRTEYAVLEETLARRTYDESGNYTVRPFGIDVREYRDNNRGAFKGNTVYLYGDVVTFNKKYYVARNTGTSSNTTSPTSDSNITWEENAKPYFNRGIYPPASTVSYPVLDENGDPTFNVDSDGVATSQIFATRPATVADNEAWDAKLAVGIEPGKAYVFGYEIEKIGTTYVEVEKSRETVTEQDVLFPTDYGNYVLVNNLNFVPDISTFPVAKLYNYYTDTPGQIPSGAVEVGSARIRSIEPHTVSGYYKLFLFDVSMNVIPGDLDKDKYNFNYTVKQVRIDGVTDEVSFTADAAVLPELKSGSITISGTSIVGNNTKFKTEFAVGDWLYIQPADPAASPLVRRINSIADNVTMTLSASGGTHSGIPVYKSTAFLQETAKSALIFPLPNYAIKDVPEASYYVRKVFNETSGVASGGTALLTILTSGGNEFANPNDSGNFLLFSKSDGALVTPVSTIREPGNEEVKFYVDDAYQNTDFTVIATIQKEAAIGRKTKSIATHTVTVTSKVAAQAKKIFLQKPDGIVLKSVKMKSGSFTTPGATYSIDITSRYRFSDGQTASYYGISSISLRDGQALPSAPIQITFEYFEHVGSGDFFTVDSYPNYKEIPKFSTYQLRDCIDFRPRVDDGADSTDGDVVFTGGDDLVPKYGEDMTISYSYYLARKAKIGVNKAGAFSVVNSASSLTPQEPADPNDAMVIYKLELEPYTFSTNSASVVTTAVENQRYTMKDIGKLEKRIDQLEYYTTLSMLENDTKNMTIRDADGLDRFKNGFIVDNFTGHNVGDATSPDYVCSVDMENNILRPFYSMENVDFVETFTNNTDRAAGSRNYQLTGDVITLPYTSVELISQPMASKTENVNPFAVFSFIGRMTMTPPFDRWFEVKRRPDIVVNVEGNYNTIATLAEKAGVLGTVWNAWQTNWTGAQTGAGRVTFTAGDNWASGFGDVRLGIGELQDRFGGAGSSHWNARQVTVEQSAQQVNQTRTGIRTAVKEKMEYKTVDDKVLSVATIPYIRSRKMLVQVKGLKAKTRFYPYFDKKNVSAYCQRADKIVITKLNSIEFDMDSNTGNDYKNEARSFGPNPELALNVGDVITGATSGATAIVVGEQILVSGERSIYVVNVKDPKTSDGVGFAVGEVITGSVSGATATVVSHTKNNVGGELISGENGDLQFLFDIPNTTSMRFRTGKREMALLDYPTYDTLNAESSALGEYAAEGFLETRQSTVQAIRNAELVQEQVSQNRTIVQTTERVVGDTGWYDPLAQTFLIDGFPDAPPTGNVSGSVNGGGCFITKVDLYFATKDDAVPVTLQIRDVVNGYPGKTVLPFAQCVLPPHKVNTSTDASVATTFTFPSPVYVQNATEYCLAIITDSTKYKVWISELGQKNIGTDDVIDKQPYAGVFFKSQNASTWTADQMQDLKFKIHRAKFKTGKFGRVEFENAILPDVYLEDNPIQFTEGSNKVRIEMQNHGLTGPNGVLPGSKVTLRVDKEAATGTIVATKGSKTVTGTGTFFESDLEVGANIYRKDGTLIGEVQTIVSNTSLTLVANSPLTYNGNWQFANPIFGVSPANIFKQHTVTAVEEFDYFVLTLAEAATQSGYGGGSGIRASRNIQYDAVQPLVTAQKFTNTQIIPYFLGISGKSLDGTQLPYQTPDEMNRGYLPITLNETNKLAVPYMIASDENAASRPQGGSIDLSTKTGQRNSAIIRLDIYSDIDTLSPVIDSRSVSAILVSNKINKPTAAINDSTIDTRTIVSAAADVTFDGTNVISIGDTGDNRAEVSTLYSGQYITISGSSVSANNGMVLLTDVSADGSTLTVNKNLSSGTGDITIVSHDRFFDEITPVGSSTYSKYVTKKINLSNPSTYLKIRMAASVPTATDIGVYYKLNRVGSYEDFTTVEYAKATATFQKANDGLFKDVDIDIPDLPDFDGVSIKLVFTSTNSVWVPQVKDLRIIACV